MACASYPERTAEAYSAFESGRLEDAAKMYADPETTGSDFLCGAEAGSVDFAAGDWKRALEHYSDAYASVEDLEARSLVSPKSAGESLLSWAVNESVTSYQGEGFERVMLHACMGLAYLGLGKLDDAGVEARRANKLLEGEEALYEKQYKAGGLGHFLSALMYELQGQPDNAFIDYQRMLEKEVGVQIAGRAALRLARQLGYREDAEKLSERFGADSARPDGAASIVVIAGVGAGPFKEAITLDIPTPQGILQWSVPRLAARMQIIQALELSLEGSSARVRTDVIEDVFEVTRENLDDRIAWLATKSAVRSVLKLGLTHSLGKDHGLIGALAGTVYTLATEHADLRAWQTLPNTWQAARVFVAPGEHTLRLEAIGGESRVLGRFELAPGETMFVLARALGPRLYAHAIGGARRDQAHLEFTGEKATAQTTMPPMTLAPSSAAATPVSSRNTP
ncbi:MAG TPA: hypothetical protein VM509_12600 [Planctomycetota bacterium]|nr:hypothetical protein [Planctomycetota bacterium]